MKNLIFALVLFGVVPALHAGQEEALSVLFPVKAGEMGSLNEEPIETKCFIYSPCSDGMVLHAAYRDGCVSTMISGSASNSKQEGTQYIYHKGKEISKSTHVSKDPDNPNIVVHVHKKFLVYTSRVKQRIVPR